MCVECKWWNKEGLGFTCRAFPGGIPREIILTLHDHRFPFPGDHGIRYEPADPKNEVPTAKFPKDKKPPSVAAQDRLINRMLINRMRRKKFAEMTKKDLQEGTCDKT